MSANQNNTQIPQPPRLLLVANVAKEHVLKFHVPTIRMLKERGWDVDVACSGEESVPFCNHQYRLSYRRSPFNLALFKGIAELRQIINQGEYDIVYCHTPVGGLAARLASRKARKKGTRVVYCAHGYHFYQGAPLWNWLVYYPLEKWMSHMTDVIILINNEDYQRTRRSFRWVHSELIDGIGVDPSRLEPRPGANTRQQYRTQLQIPMDATVLIYLAELLPNKNQTFLMRVVKRLRSEGHDVYALLPGFDHSNGSFAAYAKTLGIEEYVRFPGWREDIAGLYAAADVCTASSIREGFGLNLVEAMACGVPVVATKNRGHETIIRDGENGFLVPLGDEAGFAQRIVELCSDQALRERIVRQGRIDQEKYRCETVLEEINRILTAQLGEGVVPNRVPNDWNDASHGRK